MPRALVSGGAGFIGSHLVDRLLTDGFEVTVVDNMSTGTEENLAHVMDDIELIRSDVEHLNYDDEVDLVMHLASVANPRDYQCMQSSVLASASEGTRRLLAVAEMSGCRMIYFSSSEVYGSHPEGTVLNEHTPSRIMLNTDRSAYLVAKMFGEQMVSTARTERDMDARIVRPFNIYGRRMDRKSSYGRVMVNFIREALAGEPLTVNGDGMQCRSFCHINDFIDGLMAYTLAETENHVVNIGNPDPISIEALALMTLALTGSDSRIVHCPPVPHEPRFRCPDITLMRRLCGWNPETTLEEGLLDMIAEIQTGDVNIPDHTPIDYTRAA